jgi:F0F1-type ATP synthase assembly protein I
MGLATQFFASIAIALFIGFKIDHFFVFENPWFIWVLPLVVIIFTLLKLIIDTSKKNK